MPKSSSVTGRKEIIRKDLTDGERRSRMNVIKTAQAMVGDDLVDCFIQTVVNLENNEA
jgi:hypothetical protein